ncbi:OmpH family outer membrane protein (plasmid) [Pseudorhodobacter turbinis]|uniref:OmpH family outer membrane protein n=1 Tax=Pseudorhodobacter turbinis TaxID=2500533 RepID=A0A4P8EIW2_9RHOB|nr:OmpH family outer membrane protein [Pseudorhodobacter turbinis]QCO56907.1 OmpH family outer membrane protein [Pseudorhodobacter turbinis]
MRGGRLGALALAALLSVSPATVFAQEAAGAAQAPLISPVLSINQQRLFEESAFGKASLSRLEASSRTLQAEIRKIESNLEIEERLLTERRATMPAAEFQPLAIAFDDKVERIRDAWIAKDRELKRQRELDQQQFFEIAAPILVEMMQSRGAAILLDQSSVVLSLDRIDITQPAIELIDTRLSETPEDPVEVTPAQP